MREAKTTPGVQYAALPYMMGAGGRPRVMLVTSRGGRRWVIPKGLEMRGFSPPEVAAREAYEEAGLVGTVHGRRPVGAYSFAKRGARGQVFDVVVFLMQVDRQLPDYPERGERRTAWFDPADAATRVAAHGLADILRRVATGFPAVLDEVLTGPEITPPASMAPGAGREIAKLAPHAPSRSVWSFSRTFRLF